MWLKLNLQTPSKWMTAPTYRRPVKKKLRRFVQSLDGIVSIFMNLSAAPSLLSALCADQARKLGGFFIGFAASCVWGPATWPH
jgi:hypothetical protein